MKRRKPAVGLLRWCALPGALALLLTACNDSSSTAARSVQTTRCITDVSAADRHSFECDGVVFDVLLTEACIAEPCGLIVDVHGWLSNPQQQELRSNLARAAKDKGGYIVVQPGEQGEPPSWQPEVHNPVVFEFMQQAIEAYAVDEKRVHFTGFSQGGRMTWQFVCEHADVIASAAPLSAIETGCFRSGDGPGVDVPVLFISGVEDILVRYFSPTAALSVPYTLLQVMYDYDMTTVDADAYNFSPCGDLVTNAAGRVDVAREDVSFEVLDGSEEASYLWTRYTAADGTVFEHLRHNNGHVYPDNPDSELFPEEPAVWFSIGEAILQFFIDNPKG
tara:strand:+ start:27159 stop:28160 length:1002 start_codon:yes stop_codon:yes gene_type:complete